MPNQGAESKCGNEADFLELSRGTLGNGPNTGAKKLSTEQGLKKTKLQKSACRIFNTNTDALRLVTRKA